MFPDALNTIIVTISMLVIELGELVVNFQQFFLHANSIWRKNFLEENKVSYWMFYIRWRQ